MKRFISSFAAVAFVLSLAAMAIAADGKKAAPAPTAPAKSEPAKKDAAPSPVKKEAVKKAKTKVVTGTVEALDAAKGTFSVKGKKETLQLKAGEKVNISDIKVGDKITATYSEGVASKVVAAKKAAPVKKDAAPAPKK